MQSFPYFRLLQLWRKQALDCTMQRTLSEQQLRQSVGEHKRDRRQLQDKLREEEASHLVSKKQCKAWEERCTALQHSLQGVGGCIAAS